MSKRDLTAKFETLWKQCGGESLTREFQFHPTRKWRFDYCDLKSMIAVEIEGAVWTEGRHTRPSGFIKDCDKYNAAAAEGWYVFRLTVSHLDNDPHTHLTQIIECIKRER